MYSTPKAEDVISIVHDAGKILMDYRGQVIAEYKGDNSPVTKADQDASDIIIKSLATLTPDIPVVSEERDMNENRQIVNENETYWITDPLDGTRSYIGGFDGFGVHLALIHKGVPVMGFAFFPAQNNKKGKLYYTGNDGKSYVALGQETPTLISVNLKASTRPKVAVGWKDGLSETFKSVKAVGGARLCVTAEGAADAALFNATFSTWDVAAGDAILRGAGGVFVDLKTGQAIRYDNDSLVVPPAYGGASSVLKGLPALPKQKIR